MSVAGCRLSKTIGSAWERYLSSEKYPLWKTDAPSLESFAYYGTSNGGYEPKDKSSTHA